jgi:hypothetical protein
MSRRDAVVLVSRAVAVLLSVSALAEVSLLPSYLDSFLHYAEMASASSYRQYWHHHDLLALGFLITRIVGYSLMSMWLFRCGPDIEELLLPQSMREGEK